MDTGVIFGDRAVRNRQTEMRFQPTKARQKPAQKTQMEENEVKSGANSGETIMMCLQLDESDIQ